MERYPRWSALCLWTWAGTAVAEDWQPDRWHHVTERSPFHTEERAELHGAGILHGDGRFALLFLGDDGEGALVSVNLPMSDVATGVISTLVMPSGSILVREAEATQLLAEPSLDGTSVTYSFAIARDDIEQFMAARSWRVKAGDTLTTISLDGSGVAISAALAARDADLAETSSGP